MRNRNPLFCAHQASGTHLQIPGDIECDPLVTAPPPPCPGPAPSPTFLTLTPKQAPHSSTQMSSRTLWLESTRTRFPSP